MSIEIEVQTAKAVQNIKNVETALDALQRNVGNLGKSGVSLSQLQRDFDNLAKYPDVAVQALVKAGKTYTSELSKLKIAQTRYNKEMAALMAAGDRPERVKAVQAHLDALSLAVNGQLQKIGGVSTGIKQILMANTQDVKVAADQTVAAVGRVTKAAKDSAASSDNIRKAEKARWQSFYDEQLALGNRIAAESLKRLRTGGVSLAPSDRTRLADEIRRERAIKAELLKGEREFKQLSLIAIKEREQEKLAAIRDHNKSALRVAREAAVAERKLLLGEQRETNRLLSAARAQHAKIQLDSAMGRLKPDIDLTVMERVSSGGSATRAAVPTLAKPKEIDDVSKSLQRLTISGNDAHSMARGLASGFNLLWLTWGNLAPLLAGASLSFGVVSVVRMGSEVQHTLETIRVLSQESAQSVGALNSQMLELARTGPFGPREIADAMKTMSLAGLDASQVMASVKDVLNLAIAGDTDLKTAADVMTGVATAFGIAAEGYSYVGDIIAKTSAVSKASVDSVGESFKTASVIHKQFGVSLEDVGTAIAALANLNIKGSAAGTAVRNMYTDLSGRTPKVTAAMNRLGLELQDNNGKFKDLITIVTDLDKALTKLPGKAQKKELMTIFSERGGKPAIELLDLARREAEKTGDTVQSVLAKMRADIENSLGFMAIAAAELAMTPANQMKSVLSSLQATLVETFKGLEPTILGLSYQLKSMFNSQEFKTGLATLVTYAMNFASALATVTRFAVENSKVIATLTLGYIGLRLAVYAGLSIMQALTARKVAATAASAAAALATGAETLATNANTVATNVNNKAKMGSLGTLGLFARLIPGIGTAVTFGAAAWLLYDTIMGSSRETSEKLAKDNSSGEIIKKLNEETARLNENTEAMIKNMSVEELRLSKQASAPKVKSNFVREAETKVQTLESQLATARRNHEASPYKGGGGMDRLARELSTAKRDLSAAQQAQEENRRLELRANSAAIDRHRETSKAERKAISDKAEADAKVISDSFGKGLPGLPGMPGAGPGGSTFQSIERFTSKIKAEHDTQLQDLREHHKKLQQVMDDRYAAGVLSEGQYQAQRASLMATSYAEAAKKLKDNHDKEISELDAFQAEHKDKYKVGTKARAEFEREVFREREAINNKFNKDKLKAEEEAAAAERAIWSKHHKELLAIRTSTQDAILASQGRILEAQENSDFADRTAGLTGADKAAAEARFSVERALGAEVRKINADIANERRIQEDLLAAQALETNEAAYAAQQTRLDESRVRQEELEKGRLARETQAEIEAKAMVGKAYGDAMRAEHEKLKADLSDALMTALTEGGKAGSAKLRSIIEAKLREPVTLVVNAIVDTFMGSVFGGGGGAAGGGGGSNGLLSQGAKSLFGSAASSFIGNTLGGGTAGALAGGALGTMSFANVAGSLAANAAGTGISGLLATNAAYGTAAAATGTAAAGAGAATGIAGAVSSALAAIPVWGWIALGVAALWKPLFGRKLKDSGIEGTFSGADKFSGNSYEFYKGGLFRSNKTKRSALDGEVTDALGTAFKAVRDGVIGMAETLGLGAEALDGYTRTIKLSTKGMNEKQVQEAWAKEFENMSEEMAQRFMGTFETTTRGPTFIQQLGRGSDSVADGLLRALSGGRTTTTWTAGPFVREGETALQALTRLATSLQTVNATFDTLNYTLYATSLAGGDMASQLVDLFGGIEGMVGATGAYYQAFYSDAERAATATRQLGTVMSALGVTMPTSRDAFRDLVESQDLTTDAGRKMFAELIKLAPAFADVTSAMQDMSNSLIEEVRRLRGEIYGSSAASLEAQFALTTAAARAGDTNAMALLPSITQALEETAALNAVTAADLTIARARLAASLTETLATQGITVPGLTTSGKPGTGLPSTLDPNRVYHQGSELPAFANGGMYGGGLALVGERGPELINFRRGGQVHTAQQTRALMGQAGDDNPVVNVTRMLLAELTNLRGEVTMLRAETRATAVNTSKSTRLLERVTRDGESLQVTSVDPA